MSSVTAETNWVTYTIGGNDAGFSSVITECALPGWLSDCNGKINEAQSIIKNTLPGRLDEVNNAIKSRAPNAEVIAVTAEENSVGVSDRSIGRYSTYARSGNPRGPRTSREPPNVPVTVDQVIEALRPVQDPELHRSIVELGMVKGIAIDGGTVQIQIALTVAGCPLRAEITNRCTAAVQALEGVTQVDIGFGVMTDE